MTPTSINYSESIETVMPNGLKRWRKLEISGTIQEGESFPLAAVDAQAKLQAGFKAQDSMKPASTWEGSLSECNLSPYPSSQPPKDDREERVQIFLKEIRECVHIDEKNGYGYQIGLLSYEHLCKEDPRIEEAYNLKLKELS
jgi:hypothetical protein